MALQQHARAAGLPPSRTRKRSMLRVEDQLTFERKGWLLTRGLLEAGTVASLKLEAEAIVAAQRLQALQQRVRVLCPQVKQSPASEPAALRLLREQGSDGIGFLQFFNAWANNAVVAGVVANPMLAGTAATLLGVPRIRLFQDCIFLKEPGFTETNWHSDLRMTPLDTNSYVTAWIPLRAIGATAAPAHRGGSRQRVRPKHSAVPATPDGLGDSGLLFAESSHRDFALPFWHDLRGVDLSTRGYPITGTGAMQLGDVSWHHGWTVHSAGPQPPGSTPRLAMAVSYFADGARLLKRRAPSVHTHMLHDEDAESYGWLGELRDGARAVHARLPLVYPANEAFKAPLLAAAPRTHSTSL